MVINISVQYSGGLLPDIILLTQGYYQWGGFVFTTFVMYITTTMCEGVLHCLLFLMFFWCPYMTINVNVHFSPTLYC